MGSRISVFIIAGSRLLREALSRILNKRSDIAVEGADALSAETVAQVAQTPPGVLLLDAENPGANLEFLRTMRVKLPQLRVVMIGMEEDENLFLRYVRAGAVGYVLKDASAIEVVNAVRMVHQGEAACPPRLGMALFREFARHGMETSSVRIRLQFGLTRRERQLVPFIAQGLTNKEIAAHFNLSEQTVKNHIHRMMQKTGADARLRIVEQCLGYEQ